MANVTRSDNAILSVILALFGKRRLVIRSGNTDILSIGL